MRRKRRRKLRKIDMVKLLELRGRAIKEAYRFGPIFQSPEDAAQEYVVRLLEGRHRHATVGQAMIDIARETVNMRGKNSQSQFYIASPIPFETEKLDKFPTYQDVDTSLLFEDLMETLSDQQRMVIELYRLGNTLYDISKSMKLTESRVHQIYKKAIVLMRARSERRPLLKMV